MDWKRYGGALLLACVSLSVQAKIKSCDDEAVISQVSEIPAYRRPARPKPAMCCISGCICSRSAMRW